METIKQFFQEGSSMSLMRLMCFICLIVAIVKAFTGGTLADGSLWLGVAFGSKLIQKPMETKEPKPIQEGEQK